jgi:hypothetical protein
LIRKLGTIGLVLVLSALLLSACGATQRAVVDAVEEAVSTGIEQAQEAAASSPTEAPPSPTDSPKADEAPAAPTTPPEEGTSDEPASDEPAIDPKAVTAFNQLASYRMVQMTRWSSDSEDGPGTTEMRVEITFVREPRAMEWHMTEVIDDGSSDAFSMIWVDGILYMGSGDDWMAVASDDEMDDPWAMPPDRYISSSSERVGTETIHGMRTIHYRERSPDVSLMGLGQIAQADYWISEEHDIVVRSIIVWNSKDDDGNTMTYEMQWDVTEINQPITIVAPEGVAKPGLPEDIPFIAEAYEIQSVTGYTTFEVDVDALEVMDYYLEALSDFGWSMEEDFGVMFIFSKDGRGLTLMIDDGGPPTRVTIIIDEE